MHRRLAVLAAATAAIATLSIGHAARAQTASAYMTVDAVNLGATSISVTGVPVGESTPTTRTVNLYGSPEAAVAANLERCYRQLLLALSKPGQYVANVGNNVCSVKLANP